MRLLWLLTKYNFIFNKIKLSVMAFVSFVILYASWYFNEDSAQAGSDILQYSSYIIFIIITGKINLRNNSMFDIKHLVALPFSKREIVFHKSVADLVHFFPISFVTVLGFKLAFPQYHTFAVFVIFHVVLVIANMIALNKRIDFARMQHVSASFKNTFMYLNKYIDLLIQLGAVTLIVSIILAMTGKHVLSQEYAIFVFVCLVLFTVFTNTVKMLSNETLSYFFFKRDIKKIALKLTALAIPVLIFNYLQQNKFFQKGINGDNADQSVAYLTESIKKYSTQFEEKKLLLSIANKDNEEFFNYLEKNKTLPWKAEILGGYLPHIATQASNKVVLDKLFEIKPDSVNIAGSIKKRTPVFTSLRNCNLALTEYLIEKGADLEHRDIDGNTPVMFAAANRCYGGVVLLNKHNVVLDVKNNDNKSLSYYLKGSGIDYIIDLKKLPSDNSSERAIASEPIDEI